MPILMNYVLSGFFAMLNKLKQVGDSYVFSKTQRLQKYN